MSDETVPQDVTLDGSAHTLDGSTYQLARSNAQVVIAFKRMLDLSAAIILLLIVLPLGCLITLFIALDGQNPFESHMRLGQGGQTFGLLKFRTTRSDADTIQAGFQTSSDVKLQQKLNTTRLGQFLHATSLDELPQLINILIGQMSFLGPRPVSNDEVAKFYNASEAAAYFSVRPGLVGWYSFGDRSPS